MIALNSCDCGKCERIHMYTFVLFLHCCSPSPPPSLFIIQIWVCKNENENACLDVQEIIWSIAKMHQQKVETVRRSMSIVPAVSKHNKKTLIQKFKCSILWLCNLFSRFTFLLTHLFPLHLAWNIAFGACNKYNI